VWQIIECEPVVDSIKRAGYDGFEVIEKGVKNLAIFDEGSIKGFSKIL
jgi:sugar phosphate isomerase/epimerase